MNRQNCMTAILLGLFLLQSGAAQAHTELAEVIPADGAVINQSLPRVELNFTGEVRLLRLTLNDEEQHAVDIGFTPTASAQRQFAVSMPTLPEGQYQMQWTIMGEDGHRMDGSSVFTLAPTEASLQGSQSEISGEEGGAETDHSARGQGTSE